MNKRLSLLIALCISISTFLQGANYYVKTTGTGTGTGGWGNAMGSLAFSQALVNAQAGDVFYVAAGTYYPEVDTNGNSTPSNVRTKTFTVKSGISIIGSYRTDLTGAQNGEQYREYKHATDGLAPTTVFSGDLNGNGIFPDYAGDAFIIIDAHTKNTSNALPRGTIKLDGIKVTQGTGGISSRNTNLEAINCSVEEISGVSSYHNDGIIASVFSSTNGDCTIKNSSFTENIQYNTSGVYGIINVNAGNLDIFNSTIAYNTCDRPGSSGNGCTIINYYSTDENIMRIYNSTISNNILTADTRHGGIYINNRRGEVHIVNSTITDNQCPTGLLAGAGIAMHNYEIVERILYSDNPNPPPLTRAFGEPSEKIGSRLDTVYHFPTIFNIDNTIIAGNATNDIALIDRSRIDDPDGFEAPATNSINGSYKNGDIYQLPHFNTLLPKTSIIGNNKFYNNSETATTVSFSTTSNLGVLAYKGGLTKTRELLGTASTNHAISNGNTDYNGSTVNPDGLNRDQRRFLRLSGAVSIGAFQHNGIDDGGGAIVSLDITVFLQGVLQGGTMTNYIQTANAANSLFSVPRLPLTDPYEGNVTFTNINNVGAAGAVVDWIQVEIWSNVNMSSYSYSLVESKALLLRPDGKIVDIDGTIPHFRSQIDPVRVIIKHRNHLGVMSKEITSFTGTVTYDFSTAVSRSEAGSGAPMVEVSGIWCLWAGDTNMDGAINSADNILTTRDFSASKEDEYLATDLNMDGVTNAIDNTLRRVWITMGLESILMDF